MACPLNPRLVGIGGPVEGAVFALADDEVSIGRDPSSTLQIDDPLVSRRHCSIRRQAEERFEIRDLSSRNGTLINGVPVVERVLRHGDGVRLGDCRFLFLLLESSDRADPIPIEFDHGSLDTQTTHQFGSEQSQHLKLGTLLEDSGAHAHWSLGLAAILKITAGIQVARGTEAIARQLLERIFEAIPARQGAVLLFQGAGDEPDFAYCRDRDGAAKATVQANSGIVDQVRREGAAVLTRAASPAGPRSVLAAPIMSQDRVLGLIYLDAGDPRVSFGEEHLVLTSAFGGILGTSFENSQRLEWLEAENRRLDDAIATSHDMVGASPVMKEVFQFVAKVAHTDSTVLIRGESGTGKELVARAIHRNSPRAGQAFVAINCAALTETLLESELFGHEKGAFTGAIAQKRGKLEIADRGTVFLDEVGELPPPFQSKLLRVLQEREFERVGGTRPIQVDIRLIAATNRDLEGAIASGAFRKDLYYRLNVVALTLPPLRERRGDIPALARYFAARHGRRAKRRLAGFSPQAMACLEAYDWPGNVRELENAVERAVVLGSTDLIVPEDLPETVLDTAPAASAVTGGYYQAVREEKKRAILAALEQAGGSFTEAAKLLGVHPNYLHRLVRNLNLKSTAGKRSAG
jgi:Nif-specific regulatory protein